ncbi:unnamed protein product [Parajaminaea phylloscopi]
MDGETYVDDLELLEEYDLENESDESESQAGPSRRSKDSRWGDAQDDGEDEVDLDTAMAEIKTTVVEVVSALGGIEEQETAKGTIESIYVIGDDCLRCLRDLRRLWREDADDPDRAIAQVFAQVGVFQNLIPLFLKTAGGGERNQKIALACVDLLTSITWPVDAYAELRVAEARGLPTDNFASLLRLQRGMIAYKAATLRQRSGETGTSDMGREVLPTVMRHILIPSLSKPRHHRNERDVGTVSMVLHFFRNLLAIPDPTATSLSSNEEISNSMLQSDLVCAMAKNHILETILMLACNAGGREFEQWNIIIAEIVYTLFGGQSAAVISGQDEVGGESNDASRKRQSDHQHRPAVSKSSALLSSSLEAEAHQKRISIASSGSSRHSRFGTTLSFFTADGERRVARNASSLRKSVAELRQDNEQRNRRKIARRKRAKEDGAPRANAQWTTPARAALADWADQLILSGAFDVLTHSVLQDIRSERAKVGDLDQARVRLLLLSRFFLDYFLIRRTTEDRNMSHAQAKLPLATNAAPAQLASEQAENDEGQVPTRKGNVTDSNLAEVSDQGHNGQTLTWSFSLLAQWLKPWAFRMVSARSAQALESKLWLELEAALQVWTGWLKLVDYMSRKGSEAERDVAESLQANHFYDSETLDLCLKVARCYTSQSLQFLEAVVAFTNCMPRLLERYSTNKEHIFYRAKRHVRKARAGRKDGGDSADANAEDEEAETFGTEEEETQAKADRMYTERRFSFDRFQNKLCTRPLVDACVGYLGRWRDFTLPADQLGNVVGVMHRIAIKAGDTRLFYPEQVRLAFAAILKGPFVAALKPQAGQAVSDCRKLVEYCLKRYEKLPQEQKDLWALGKAMPRAAKKHKIPREIEVKSGFSRDDQVGVAVGLLSEQNKMARITWVKEALEYASAQRQQIVFSVDGRRMWEAARRQKEIDGEEGGTEPTDEEREAIMDAIADSIPSQEAVAQFEAYELGYDGDAELLEDATKLPSLKLLCRLMGLESDEDDDRAWKWRIPAHILPSHLGADSQLVEEFIRSPLSIEADNYELLTQNVRKPRAVKAKHLAPEDVGLSDESESDDASSDSDSDASVVGGDDRAVDKDKTKRGRGHRRRKDLVGDKRKKKGFRRKPASAAPLFLADDLIDSDEEEQVDRLWAQQNGLAPPKTTSSSHQEGSATVSRPRPRALVPERRSLSKVSDDDEDSDDAGESGKVAGRNAAAQIRPSASREATSSPAASATTPATSPLNSDKAHKNSKRAVRSSRGLFFSTDTEDEGEEDEVSDSQTVARRRMSDSPENPADSTLEDLLSPASGQNGRASQSAHKRASRAALEDSEEESDGGEAELPSLKTKGGTSSVRHQAKRPRTRPSLAATLSALADSEEDD